MKTKLRKGLWMKSSAGNPNRIDHFTLVILIIAGVLAIVKLGEWWFTADHIANKILFVILSTFFWYSVFRLILIWINYISIEKPVIVPQPESGLKVAIFTTAAPGEPVSMFENTFKALNNLNYPHVTYLLDGSKDNAMKRMAEKYNITRLDMEGVEGAKAGKVNKALKLTTEEYILILDPDHIVFPEFLDQTLGFFQDPDVGFVQVSQGYYNMYRSFIAKGAAEQTYTFYGPMQMGLYGMGNAVAIGANCTFRRDALLSIGGHATGLAEDLQTSMRLHAKGWKSVYNPVVVSRGLVPEDFVSFSKQQLKWARGAFELLFDEYPYIFKKLEFWQKLSYLTIGTYYLFGVIASFFIMVPYLYFFFGLVPANMDFIEFVQNGMVILLASLLIYLYAQKFLADRNTESGLHWRGMLLKFATIPVFLFAFILTLIKKKIPYVPTSKTAIKNYLSPFIIPVLVYPVVFMVTLAGVIINRRFFVAESELLFTSKLTWGMLGFSFLIFMQSIIVIMAIWNANRISEENPWDRIFINEDKSIEITDKKLHK